MSIISSFDDKGQVEFFVKHSDDNASNVSLSKHFIISLFTDNTKWNFLSGPLSITHRAKKAVKRLLEEKGIPNLSVKTGNKITDLAFRWNKNHEFTDLKTLNVINIPETELLNLIESVVYHYGVYHSQHIQLNSSSSSTILYFNKDVVFTDLSDSDFLKAGRFFSPNVTLLKQIISILFEFNEFDKNIGFIESDDDYNKDVFNNFIADKLETIYGESASRIRNNLIKTIVNIFTFNLTDIKSYNYFKPEEDDMFENIDLIKKCKELNLDPYDVFVNSFENKIGLLTTPDKFFNIYDNSVLPIINLFFYILFDSKYMTETAILSLKKVNIEKLKEIINSLLMFRINVIKNISNLLEQSKGPNVSSGKLII